MKYDVIFNDYLQELIIQVNKKIKQGWKPLGGVIIWNNDFMQTLTLDDDNKP